MRPCRPVRWRTAVAGGAASVTLRDPALLIYTSGTTGLPKAAQVSHHRVMSWSGWFAGLLDAAPDDRLYDCLPMYHSAGGVVGDRRAADPGRPVVIARNSRPARFWDDVVRSTAPCFSTSASSAAIWSAAPPHAAERAPPPADGLRQRPARRRLAAFQARFAIPRILEFYAATEGNFSLYNVEGQPGRHRPRAGVHRPPLPRRHRPLRSDDRRAGAWAGRLLPALRARRGRRGHRPHQRRPRAIPPIASRATPIQPTARTRCCAMCSRRATPGCAPAI